MRRIGNVFAVLGSGLVPALVLLQTACGAGGPASGAGIVSFTAEQVVSGGGVGRQAVSRCFFAPGKFRIEMRLGHRRHAVVTIGRQDLGKAWVLFPAMRRYREIPLADAGGGNVDLAPAQEDILERLGYETVDGRRCEKLKIRRRTGEADGGGGSTATVWVADGFPVPLRTVTGRGAVTEYRHITVGPQPEEIFELPDGYTKMAGGTPAAGGR